MPSPQEFVENPWFQVAGFVVGILGLLVAVFTWLLSRRYKRMYFMVRSFNLVNKKRSTVPSLSVSFSGRPVDALTISKVAIWNSGTDAILNRDIPSSERIRIQCVNGADILECSIIQVSSPSCNCRIDGLSNNSQALLFDFLDPDDGLVLQVAHTGSSSRNIVIKGQIIGNGRIMEKQPFSWLRLSSLIRLKKWQLSRGKVAFLVALMGLTLILAPMVDEIFIRLLSDYQIFSDQKKVITFLSGASGAMYLLFAWALWASRPPRGLSSFDDGFESKSN